MSYFIQMSTSEIPNNELVFGMTSDFKNFNIVLKDATQQNQQICNDIFNLVGGHMTVVITNSPYNFEDVNYILNGSVGTDVVEVDYSSLSVSDKEKVDNFSNLLLNSLN
jgi:hypothetical protein